MQGPREKSAALDQNQKALPRKYRFFDAVITAPVIMGSLPLLAWLVPNRGHMLDILAQLAIPAAACAFIFAIVMLLVKRIYIMAVCTCQCICLVLLPHVAIGFNSDTPDVRHDTFQITCISYNARGYNTSDHSQFIRWALSCQPDIINVIEAPLSIRDPHVLTLLREQLPFSLHQGGTPGKAIYSRFPIHKLGQQYRQDIPLRIQYTYRPVEMAIDDNTTVLWSPVHLPSPKNARQWQDNVIAAEIGSHWLRRLSNSSEYAGIVAVGDFNATTTSRTFEIFRQDSGLVPTTHKFWPRGTWPAALPTFLSLRIDQAWISHNGVLREQTVGPRFESDHRPILLRLSFTRAWRPDRE